MTGRKNHNAVRCVTQILAAEITNARTHIHMKHETVRSARGMADTITKTVINKLLLINDI